jgi:hypothetical protein
MRASRVDTSQPPVPCRSPGAWGPQRTRWPPPTCGAWRAACHAPASTRGSPTLPGSCTRSSSRWGGLGLKRIIPAAAATAGGRGIMQALRSARCLVPPVSYPTAACCACYCGHAFRWWWVWLAGWLTGWLLVCVLSPSQRSRDCRTVQGRIQLPNLARTQALGRARSRQLGWQDVYTYTKCMAEMKISRFTAEKGVPTVILRPSIIEGVAAGPHIHWLHGWAGAAATLAALSGPHQALPGAPFQGLTCCRHLWPLPPSPPPPPFRGRRSVAKSDRCRPSSPTSPRRRLVLLFMTPQRASPSPPAASPATSRASPRAAPSTPSPRIT